MAPKIKKFDKSWSKLKFEGSTRCKMWFLAHLGHEKLDFEQVLTLQRLGAGFESYRNPMK